MIVLSVTFTVPLDPLYLNARKPDDSPMTIGDGMDPRNQPPAETQAQGGDNNWRLR